MVSGGNDGDNFWPGYVDAISNLVLNLLFVVSILTIAVFIFAIELGRKQSAKVGAQDEQKSVGAKAVESSPLKEKARLEEELNSLRQQVAALKEAKVASAKVSVPAPAPAPAPVDNEAVAPVAAAAPATPKNAVTEGKATPKVVEATQKLPEAEKDIEKIQYRGAAVVVDFNADAVALTKDEMQEARKALGGVAASGGARLEVAVNSSFSEARRLAFYRAMAVRNLLIEMGVPVARIDISIHEVKPGGDSTKVLVRGIK